MVQSFASEVITSFALNRKHSSIEPFLSSFVLILAGINLIFFVMASMGPCLAFLLDTMLIIQGYLIIPEQYLHNLKDFSETSQPIPPARKLGVQKKLWGDTDGVADPS